MIRVTVSYPAREGGRFDHDYYLNQHAALVRQLLEPHGLRNLQIDKALFDGAGKPPPVVASAQMLFDDLAAFKAAMGAGGKALAADLVNYSDLAPVVLVSELR